MLDKMNPTPLCHLSLTLLSLVLISHLISLARNNCFQQNGCWEYKILVFILSVWVQILLSCALVEVCGGCCHSQLMWYM